MMSGMGISLGGLEIATDYLYANPEFYEPDLTEVKATISNKPNKQLKPRVKPVKPKVSKESIISKYSIIQPKLKVTADEVIEDDMVVQDDKDFDFSFDDFDMGDSKQGQLENEVSNIDETDEQTDEQVVSDADLINQMLMQQLAGRTSEVYGSDSDSEDEDEVENKMNMDEDELDNEIDEDDALLNEMFGNEEEDSDSDDELLAEMFDDEDSDEESESYEEESDTEEIEKAPVSFEVQAPQTQVDATESAASTQEIEDTDEYSEESDIEDDDDLLNEMFDDEDDNYDEEETDSYEDGATDEDGLADNTEDETYNEENELNSVEYEHDNSEDDEEESDDDLLAEMFGDDIDESEYDENEDDSDIEENEDYPELEDDEPEIDVSDSESEMSSLSTSISENQESIEEKSREQVQEINVSNKSKVTSENSEESLQKKLAEAMAEIERLKNGSSKPADKEEATKDDASDKIENKKDKYMMYAGMSTEKLYGQVKEFMIASNVSKKPVDLAVLYDKFGDANVKKLIHKSYLIKLGKGVTIGR